MMISRISVVALFNLLVATYHTEAFVPSHHQRRAVIRKTADTYPSAYSRLYFFGRNKDDDEASEADNTDKKSPFFARFGIGKNENEDDSEDKASEQNSKVHETVAAVATVANDEVEKEQGFTSGPLPRTSRAPKRVVDANLSPLEQAAALQAQAKKIRLEAEKQDAELTLAKITKLEKEIAHAKRHKESHDDAVVESLQRELQALEAKMRGEAPAPVIRSKPLSSKSESGAVSGTTDIAAKVATRAMPENGFSATVSMAEDPAEALQSLDELTKFIENSPKFMKKALAAQVELDYADVETLNTTEMALRVDKMRRLDFSFSARPKPRFTLEEVNAKKKELSKGWAKSLLDPRLTSAASGNETELALLALEYEYYNKGGMVLSQDHLSEMSQDDEFIAQIVSAVNKSAVDSSIETLFPKCTRKEGQAPTMAQVQRLITDVLPKAKFSSTSKPEPVAGGFVIRGINKAENGDELIEAIDKQLTKYPNLADKLSVLYTNDFTVFASTEVESDEFNFDDVEPILYVTGPNIVREPRRVLLSLTSALGIASSWYLSLYPFLLNPALSKRVDEQLALADANMTPDLTWLTDLSLPLFTTFVSIQLIHEIAHRAVAAFYDIKVSAPTWVPSIFTGITSSVTTFRTLPKNKQAMFDFSVAGPLAGMIASAIAIFIGSQITANQDASLYPALPLEILRQSTLGGGIIESMLGSGALSVPGGALGTQAVAQMMIPLHPVAVAGYISLVLNALAMLPVGTTDGGRIALSVFGRGAKLLVGNAFLFAMLAIGLLGSDLFLFYFAFCIAFQPGNEIPSRNEVDRVDFSRVVVATSAYIVAILALIPFQ
jgi:membrane-associated protease RseP (regulator of RpoE activity)